MKSFKPIKGFSNYYINKLGEVKSTKRKQPIILVPHKTNSGYLRVNLLKDGKKYHRSIHRLVAEAFISNKENKREVNHIDNNPLNNNVNNLEWVTSSENSLHSYKHGNRKPTCGEVNGMSILNNKKVIKARKMYNTGKYTITKLAGLFKVSISCMSCVVNKTSWRNI